MPEFLMPKLSDTMEEGTVLRWLVAEGETVAPGQQLVEIETDKANMVVEASDAGVLHQLVGEGDVRPVGAPIATIGEGASSDGAASDGAAAGPSAVADDAPVADRTLAPEASSPPPPVEQPQAAEPAPAAPVEDEAEERTNIPVADDGTPATIGGEIYPGAEAEDDDPAPAVAAPPPPASAPRAPVAPAPAAPRDGRPKASPLARRRALERGIDLSGIAGTGPGGRIVRADVDAAAAGSPVGSAPAPAPAAEAPAPAPPASPAQPGARVPLTRLQATIARRMAQSASTAPHFHLQRDVDVTEAAELRRRLVEAAGDGGPSLNDLVIRAVALAAAARPQALRRFDGDALVEAPGVHVGVAVAVEGGLVVPVVRDAAGKGVGRIAAEVRDLAGRCRAGTITPAELEGGAITVTNLGMYGVDRFAAVINPPESAILAVGRAAPRPVVREGAIVARDVMTLTLSVDHRALHGAEAAQLLDAVARLLERPHALLL